MFVRCTYFGWKNVFWLDSEEMGKLQNNNHRTKFMIGIGLASDLKGYSGLYSKGLFH